MRDNRMLYPDGEGGGPPSNEDEQEDRIAVAEARAAEAVGRYRQIVAAWPGLVPELVHGDTIGEIDASAEAARRAYGEISRRVAEQFEQSIPTGNPPRSAASIGAEALKPEAKIALGLSKY